MFKNRTDRYLIRVGYTDEKIVGLSISQWLPCPLAIWNLLFGMAILLNLVKSLDLPALQACLLLQCWCSLLHPTQTAHSYLLVFIDYSGQPMMMVMMRKNGKSTQPTTPNVMKVKFNVHIFPGTAAAAQKDQEGNRCLSVLMNTTE